MPDPAAERPLIAIAPDIAEPAVGKARLQCSMNYPRAVAAAGGQPVFLAPVESLIEEQLRTFDGFVLTGGDDPRMEQFGEPTHPEATPVHELRQSYETLLIQALLARPDIPVLGICLGMQMMALVAGGKLDQHLPDSRPDADRHRRDAVHPVQPVAGVSSGLVPGRVTSHHRQAVTDAGSLQIAAFSDDGIIEAVARPGARFCLGVQWHPERTADEHLGGNLFASFVEACRIYRAERH